MASVFDVAQYILRDGSAVSAMKLQKLVYYSQVWSLVWDEAPLFNERIEAWVNGPVVPDLYQAHRGQYQVTAGSLGVGDIDCLSDEQRETIDSVLGYYGDKTAQWLSDLTHNEDPWKQAREGLNSTSRGSSEISLESMAEYYTSLQSD